MKTFVKNTIKRLLGLQTPELIDVLKKKGLRVGENFTMREGCIIDFSHAWHIEIGNNVTLAPRVHILAHDASTWHYLGHSKIRNVKIGDNVFIGASSIILPGVTIGNDVVVGAGSVVTKDIAANSVVAGNPARLLLPTDVYIAREKQKMNNENCFGRGFSESENVTAAQKEKMKAAAQKFGSAFAE